MDYEHMNPDHNWQSSMANTNEHTGGGDCTSVHGSPRHSSHINTHTTIPESRKHAHARGTMHDHCMIRYDNW
eukprot:13274681-Alexandrium_andersonii.AAC.1